MSIPEGHRPCPKCTASTLGVLSVVGPEGAIRIDVCRKCRGVWLDWGEVGELHDLQKLLHGVSIPGVAGAAAWQRDLADGFCPRCDPHPHLARIEVGAYGVDRCPECLGLWFDGGELGPMLTDQGFEALLKALRGAPV